MTNNFHKTVIQINLSVINRTELAHTKTIVKHLKLSETRSLLNPYILHFHTEC